MHKPLWSLRPQSNDDGTVSLVELNPTLQEASQNMIPAGIQRIIAGHIHVFEALSFADSRAPSFVIGTGGTSLDPQPEGSLEGVAIGGTTVRNGSIVAQFGFTTLERIGSEWITQLRGVDGTPVHTCSTAGRDIDCADEP